MRKQAFEDVSLAKNCDLPARHVSLLEGIPLELFHEF